MNESKYPPIVMKREWSFWLPTPSNILFTLLTVSLLLWAQHSSANPAHIINQHTSNNVNGAISYQGRLTAPNGASQSGSFDMSFAIYDASSGGNMVWGPESHNDVLVNNGLFHVKVGSQTSGGIPSNVWSDARYLEISINGEPFAPRELIQNAPFALAANIALTVPDASITSSKLAPNSVTAGKVANNAIGSNQIIDGSIQTIDLANGSVTSAKLASGAASKITILSAPIMVMYNSTGLTPRTAISLAGYVPATANSVLIQIGSNGKFQVWTPGANETSMVVQGSWGFDQGWVRMSSSLTIDYQLVESSGVSIYYIKIIGYLE